jgi:hypothetical protein
MLNIVMANVVAPTLKQTCSIKLFEKVRLASEVLPGTYPFYNVTPKSSPNTKSFIPLTSGVRFCAFS